jgi:hypothetical protein
VLLLRVPSSSSPAKGLYNPKAFITHAASLDQACAHCPRFPTAASRRSLGRVSVPVWLIILSDQLPIAALVGRYPTNQLIGRGPIPGRHSLSPPVSRRAHTVLAAVSRGCPVSRGRFPRATHPSATGSTPEDAPPVRLACVRRAASVRSEPGSNSQLQSEPDAPTTHTPPESRSSGPPESRSPRAGVPARAPVVSRCSDPTDHTGPPPTRAKTRPTQKGPRCTNGLPPPAHPFLYASRCQKSATPEGVRRPAARPSGRSASLRVVAEPARPRSRRRAGHRM